MSKAARFARAPPSECPAASHKLSGECFPTDNKGTAATLSQGAARVGKATCMSALQCYAAKSVYIAMLASSQRQGQCCCVSKAARFANAAPTECPATMKSGGRA